jgi:hypothetical protein
VRTLDPVAKLLESNGILTIDPLTTGIDFRDPRTHDASSFDRTHLNGIAFSPNGDMLLSLGQFDLKGGGVSALLALNNCGKTTSLGVFDGAQVPRHNLIPLADGTVVFNDTPAGDIVRFDPVSNDELLRIDVNHGYLRGLLRLNDGRIVVGAQNDLVVTSLKFGAPRQAVRLSADNRESVHSIAELYGNATALTFGTNGYYAQDEAVPNGANVGDAHIPVSCC